MEVATPPPPPSRTASAPKASKAVSESIRERETFKYNSHISTDCRRNDPENPIPSSSIHSSSDSILTALAQLGIHQTGAERAFVSLFDTAYQYILAEATPTMPLTPRLPSDQCPLPLTLCNTAIPREDGICDHVLYHNSDPVSCNGPRGEQDVTDVQDTKNLPVCVVRDPANDPRFTEKCFCQAMGQGAFYAGTPIQTRRGINIGVYCVLSSMGDLPWCDEKSRCLTDISETIMQHLEANRSKLSYRRNERMNRGLRSFIEGKSTISSWQPGLNVATPRDPSRLKGASSLVQQHLGCQDAKQEEGEGEEEEEEEKEECFRNRGLTAQATVSTTPSKEPRGPDLYNNTAADAGAASSLGFSNLPIRRHRQAEHRPKAVAGAGEERGMSSDESAASIVFAKAANIIREAFEVEACLFLDVTVGSYKTVKVEIPTEENKANTAGDQASSASSSDEQSVRSPGEDIGGASEVLALSTSEASSMDSNRHDPRVGIIPKQFLAKLLRRYPNGYLFNFDAEGELQSSDSSEEDCAQHDPSSTEANVDTVTPRRTAAGLDASDIAPRHGAGKQYDRTKEASLIRYAFPGARSVIFVPVWDTKRERWLSGSFIYTLTPTRVFTDKGELSFLKAFTKLMAAEIHTVEAIHADKAKSDILGSLSHELRSPLHGVILGAELLNDTNLNVFQGNATHTIEICCRTLLDTIDHLLDYSKVNTFTVRRRRGNSDRSPRFRYNRPTQAGDDRLNRTLRLDGLVEEVVESVFAGYNFQCMSIRQLARQEQAAHVDTAAHRLLDSAQAQEQLDPIPSDLGTSAIRVGNVAVFISIDPAFDWTFRLQAGAVRRLVMNLLGNALKFTSNGCIRISLSQDSSSVKRRKNECAVKLTVQDTGKGIGEEYLRHKLFRPFTQEDELAPGTGLGLSLVKSIVSRLYGQIAVDSQVGVGTNVTVVLPLETVQQHVELSGEDEAFRDQVKDLKQLRIRVTGFKNNGNRNISRDDGGRAVVEDICRRILSLDIISDEQAQPLVPDIVLWSEDALPKEIDDITKLSNVPNIVVCQNALVAYQRLKAYETADQGGICEFISQPIGPRKLAKFIHLAYKRWMELPAQQVTTSRPRGPSRQPSAYAVTKISHGQKLEEKGGSTANSVRHAHLDQPEPLPDSSASQGAQKPDTVLENISEIPVEDEIKSKILLVDDNPINLKILSAHMGKLGFAYEAATNGKEAVEKYMENHRKFAAVFMDISMPVMDGLEASRCIRAYEHRSQLDSVPILTLTGLASDSVRQQALDSGVDAFLTKPVRLQALSEVMKSMKIYDLCAD